MSPITYEPIIVPARSKMRINAIGQALLLPIYPYIVNPLDNSHDCGKMRAANFEKKLLPSRGNKRKKEKRINDIRARKHDPGNTRFRYTSEGEREEGTQERRSAGEEGRGA